MAKNYRFVWGRNGFCGAKKIMAIDDVKKVKTHDELKVSNFRVYYEPPQILNIPWNYHGMFFFAQFPAIFMHDIAIVYHSLYQIGLCSRCLYILPKNAMPVY